MNKIRGAMRAMIVSVLALSPLFAQNAPKQPPPPMNFFLTSVGIGKGGDLGGLAGADAHCQRLAAAPEQATRPGMPT